MDKFYIEENMLEELDISLNIIKNIQELAFNTIRDKKKLLQKIKKLEGENENLKTTIDLKNQNIDELLKSFALNEEEIKNIKEGIRWAAFLKEKRKNQK